MTSKGSSKKDLQRFPNKVKFNKLNCGDLDGQKWSVQIQLSLLAWRINLNIRSCSEARLRNYQQLLAFKELSSPQLKGDFIIIVLSFEILSSGSLYLGILGFKSKLYFCTLDFCIFNLQQMSRFVCLVYWLSFKYILWSPIQLLQNCREKN